MMILLLLINYTGEDIVWVGVFCMDETRNLAAAASITKKKRIERFTPSVQYLLQY